MLFEVYSLLEFFALICVSLSPSELVHFSALIYHRNTSKAEAYPGWVRLLTPEYFILDLDNHNVTSNYTLEDGTTMQLMGKKIFDKISRPAVAFFFEKNVLMKCCSFP